MAELFDPFAIRGVTARNRLWTSPMCQYSVFDSPGVPETWHLIHLSSFAVGGSGLVMAEATAVSPEGRITPNDTGIWNDEQVAAWLPITAEITAHGAVPAIQLAHAGRKASTWSDWDAKGRTGSIPVAEGGWPTLAPSPEAFQGLDTPRELDSAGIDTVVSDFREAARRSVAAGFHVLEVHAAHGYLLHQFLSPLSNHRSDEYGGSLENRARLLLRVVAEIRAEVGESVPVFVRFSGTDWVPGGWDEDQTSTVAQWACDAGADLFDISSGGIQDGIAIKAGPGYQVHLAEHVKKTAGVPVSAVGIITTPTQAASIVSEGRADAVMIGRELLRDPHFALRAAHELGVDVDWPNQYWRGRWR